MKQTEFIVTGIPELDKELDRLDRKVRNKVARSALAKGASIGAKAVKKEIPSLLKSVKRSIGTSVKKGKEGITIAKFGTVGKRKASFKRSKGHSGGVGISKKNAHWFFMGTTSRTQKKTGRPTGAMPSNDAVRAGARKAMPAIKAGITSKAKERLLKEAQKLGG